MALITVIDHQLVNGYFNTNDYFWLEFIYFVGLFNQINAKIPKMAQHNNDIVGKNCTKRFQPI